MSCAFVIPAPLRELAGGRDKVTLEDIPGSAGSVAEALSRLGEQYPGVRDRVLNELGEVRPHVNIFVDGESIRDLGGLGAAVKDGAEIVILPAVSGG